MARSDERLYELARGLVEGMGYALVAAEESAEGGRRVVRFVIDHPQGVGLADCEAVSRELGYLLEADEASGGGYSLEVSSPGLDRELSHEREYRHFAGRRARLILRAPAGGKTVLEGTILGVEAGGVRVRKDDGDEMVIPLSAVSRARLSEKE